MYIVWLPEGILVAYGNGRKAECIIVVDVDIDGDRIAPIIYDALNHLKDEED